MRFGFEREYFVRNSVGDFVLVPLGVPMDDCGYLAEARGEAHSNPLSAAFLLLAEEASVKAKLPKGVKLAFIDTTEVSDATLRAALRRNGKSAYPHERGNLYGYDYDAGDRLCRAGLHVHFSNIRDVETKSGYVESIPQIMDMPKIIQLLDKAFKSEIDAAKRIVGCYEMKPHGFEYRSLPASVDPRKVAEVLANSNLN